MSKQQNKVELAEKTAGSNYTLSNGFMGGKKNILIYIKSRKTNYSQ